MVFEDDAALVASSPSLFASEMRTSLATLPPNWDLLDLDPHPDFCDVAVDTFIAKIMRKILRERRIERIRGVR